MPIHNVGYRDWAGAIRGAPSRCMAIAATGIKVASKSQWIRRMLLLSWLPVIYIGFGFFFFEKFMDDQLRTSLQLIQQNDDVIEEVEKLTPRNFRNPGTQQVPIPGEVRAFVQAFPQSRAVLESISKGDMRGTRHSMWCFLLWWFTALSQSWVMVVMVGLIVPPLISRDLRSRAYLMYFSRPIGRIEYFLGKMAIPCTYLALVTLLPAMAAYVFGVMMSPGLGVLVDTWDIPLRVMMAAIVLIVPASLVALMFSSLTHESRYATFAWFATWSLGEGAYRALTLSKLDAPRGPDGTLQSASNIDWSFLSLIGSIGRIQDWIYGLEPEPTRVIPFVLVWGTVTLVATFVLFRRVTAPINA